MRERGWLARRAVGFGAALVTTTGIVSLLPRRAMPGPDPGAEGPEERHLPRARHERRDVGFGAMMLGGLAVLILLAGAAGLAWRLFPRADKTLVFQPPMTYPAPQLQTSAVRDMNRFRAQQLRQLDSAYWLDKAHGLVHLPIEDAMRLVAQQGIPDWPKTPYPAAAPPQ